MDEERRRLDRVAAFERVRAFPYATNTAFDAGSAQLVGSGNCVAKAQLLRNAFLALGARSRVVRWRYRLEDPFAHLLPIDVDVHTATQVQIGDDWITVDATHDPGLPSPPFVVADWDGLTSIPPAYEPTSDVWIPGDDDAEIDRAIRDIVEHLAGHDTSAYSGAFNDWLVRSRTTP